MPGPPSKLKADRLQNASPGEPVDVWVFSAFQKHNWVTRRAADFTHAEHPGTAIQIGNDLFEILVAEETAEPGYVVRYGLKHWDARHAVRQVIPFTAERQAESAADFLDEQHKQALRLGILWLFPLAGLAPDPLQREWESKTALSMAAISAASTVSTVLLYLSLTQLFGRNPVLDYVGLESFFRLAWIAVTGKPHGTLLATLPYLLWQAITRPEKRAEKKAEALAWLEGDRVIRRPGLAQLQIHSMLYDDLLAGPAPVRFEGAVYRSVRWHEEGKGIHRRWVYDLEKLEADPKGRLREYTQPRTPERQKAVEEFTRLMDRTRILAHLWGTLPGEEQLRLATKYNFPAAKWTAITAGFFLVCAVLEVLVSVLLRSSVVLYAFPVYLLFESIYRLARAKGRGQPVGSVFGYVIKVFFRPPP